MQFVFLYDQLCIQFCVSSCFHLCLFPHTGLQRELNNNKLQAARTAALELFSEEKAKQRIQQSVTACVVNNKHVLLSDEWATLHHPSQTPCSARHFIPANYSSPFLPPHSSVPCDVFQLAPFKPPGNDRRGALSSFFGAASQKPAETADVFLQAPFGRRQETNKAAPSNAHIFRPAPLHSETPLLQQPMMAVHRVISRVGQQAAVGSVAVGPLRSWTIVGKTLNHPFNAAPFQPRSSQGKPN